jgi:pimeloyl-ACP methyl ester carboxylesterase
MADPVVFVPAVNATAELFSHQIAAVSAERTVVVANHRRHDTLNGIAGALLDELPPRFVLVGLSMGGYVAFELYRRAPDRGAALVLMDTSARPDADEARERRERLIAVTERGRFADVPVLQLPAMFSPEGAEDPTLAATVQRMAAETGPAAFVRQQRAVMGRPDSRPSLPSIECPTLIVVGEQDSITPPDIAAEMAAAIPRARLEVVPRCGHLSALERPQPVTDHLLAFLGTVPDATVKAP